MKRLPSILALVLLAAAAGVVISQTTPRVQPGPLAGGGYLLNSGWKVSPVGRVIPVSTLPMSHAISADSRYVAILNGGFAAPTVSLIDLETGKEAQRATVADGWRGTAFGESGDRLYVGGGAKPLVTQFSFASGQLVEEKQLNPFPEEKERAAHLIADVVLAQDKKTLLVADMYASRVVLMDAAAGSVRRSFPVATGPYALLPHPDGKSLFVSAWGTSRVHQYNLADGREIAQVDMGAYPTDMLLSPDGRLFTTASNTNQVSVAKFSEGQWRVTERINLAIAPKQPVGVTPSAMSLSADGQTLYIACSHLNAVAVVNVAGESAQVRGFIPTGWYPTAVRPIPGNRLLILNGKGLRSYPNPNGPDPRKWPRPAGQPALKEYVGHLQPGAVQIVDAFDAAQLADYTRTVAANSPYRDALLESAGIPAGNPIPNRPGEVSPIKHVVLLMKENRTYDQVFGDMKQSNADPSLLLFGEEITPNHHQLAREFGLLDNFYVNADVSSDGMWWTTSAIAPDHNQKTWPMSYARRLTMRPPTPIQPPVSGAPGGYLWDKAKAAGVSFYNYGFFAINVTGPAPGPGVKQITEVRDAVLRPHTNLYFRQHDRTYSDVTRMKIFTDDLAAWEKKGEMPQLVMMTIGNDHTDGTTPGHPTPYACVADNDQALGLMIEAISHSKFWKDTAIFVVEDDAQDGPDHVDSHRSPAFVISPYARRGVVESTMYNTTSILRTIELILGLSPMTTFDAAARPMWALFQSTPDLRPYTRLPSRVPFTNLNPAQSATAARSLKLNFQGSDEADEEELNDILWRAIKGTPAPPPVRSAFAR